jgi:hypothetical protein
VIDLGRSVLQSPSLESVGQWLRIFAALSDLSVEDLAVITAKLQDEHPDLVVQGLATLDSEARRNIEEFLNALDDPDLDIEAFETPQAAVAAGRGKPVLASFMVTESFDGGRRRVWAGRLKVFNANGNIVGDYTARTGGFIADYRRRNGPTPPGTYIVSNFRRNRFSAPGMVRSGVAFSFDLKETDGTPVFGRSALRIHPDQDPPGTHGCFGLAENAQQLKDCEAKLAAALNGGPFRLKVTYGAGPVA